MSTGGIVGPCWGIFRELAHSPGRETDDALILKETARRLSEREFSVELKTTEEIAELPASFEPPPFLFVMCERIAILDRTSLEEIGHIGGPGRKAGEFYHIHSLGVDPSGNLVAGESQGYRVQKFIYKGLSTAAVR